MAEEGWMSSVSPETHLRGGAPNALYHVLAGWIGGPWYPRGIGSSSVRSFCIGQDDPSKKE